MFKEKLVNSKNKFEKIRQINEELQQEINELKTINEIISFQRRRCSFRLISFVESERHNISNTNALILIRKSTKHVRDLPNCNNVEVELIKKLILRRKEIHAGQNNLYK